ncbi:hypothetical protein AVEN_244983-1 [Araneus ventricosus]|uniref:Endonuclease/exonuclease/phosphatase domain-containing protein n=1 Tax=Araneus ventricosus TaxID=182803 RepID=A0A4Y2F6B4_ARAVE|nr:hypothetical protein AVEN_244983-1 [Araneus ventricosus]
MLHLLNLVLHGFLKKEVIAVKMRRDIAFPEARQIVKDRTPKVGVSYSSTVQMQPKISNNTSEINSLQLSVSIPLSTLSSKFFTAPTATTSMKNNSSKKSTQPTPKTYLKPADIAKIKRYSIVRKDDENESGRVSGGVALLVSHDTPSSVATLHTNLQAVAVRVMLSNLVSVCTLYLPPSTNVNDRDLDRLVDELPSPFIVIGDFNGHSPLWGSKITNPRGRQIEEFINTHSLCLLNNGEDAYFHQLSRTFHSLGLALCMPSLAPYFNFRVGVDMRDKEWKVHFPIFFEPCECRY